MKHLKEHSTLGHYFPNPHELLLLCHRSCISCNCYLIHNISSSSTYYFSFSAPLVIVPPVPHLLTAAFQIVEAYLTALNLIRYLTRFWRQKKNQAPCFWKILQFQPFHSGLVVRFPCSIDVVAVDQKSAVEVIYVATHADVAVAYIVTVAGNVRNVVNGDLRAVATIYTMLLLLLVLKQLYLSISVKVASI